LTQKFIVVDDDYINNIYCRIIIEMAFPEADIQTYTDPETALVYIQSAYNNSKAFDTILFLDINMPALTGWEFLEAYEQFDLTVKNKLNIYMLSSSIDPHDKERANANKNVLDYIEKPLTREQVEKCEEQIEH
jgi:two-component SAPR family response regulator